jgi:hypothetical protein
VITAAPVRNPKKRDHRDINRGSTLVAEEFNDNESSNSNFVAGADNGTNKIGEPRIKRLRGNDEDH